MNKNYMTVFTAQKGDDKRMENTEKYFISMLDAENLETFAEGVKQSIIRAVQKLERPSDIAENKVDLTTIKTSCSIDPLSGYIEVEIKANSESTPLPYAELLKNYLAIKREKQKGQAEFNGTSCNHCPDKEKCERHYDLALAGVTGWECIHAKERGLK